MEKASVIQRDGHGAHPVERVMELERESQTLGREGIAVRPVSRRLLFCDKSDLDTELYA